MKYHRPLNGNSETDLSEIIGGVNPVREALRALSRRIERIYLARGRGGVAVQEIIELARAAGVRVAWVDRPHLDRLFKDQAHQGVVAEVGPYNYFTLENILARAVDRPTLVLILDGIQDPMNLGSLIRSAGAVGAAGVIIPRERAAPMSPAAIKASAGAGEYMAVARVVNLTRTIDTMKSQGFWIMGTQAEAGENLYDQDLNLKLGLVIGGEGQGLRTLVQRKCDRLISIPMKGPVSSLNAAVAGAVAMFEYVRQTRGS